MRLIKVKTKQKNKTNQNKTEQCKPNKRQNKIIGWGNVLSQTQNKIKQKHKQSKPNKTKQNKTK